MSIQHIALVLEAADLTVQESAILIAMCNHTDTNGKTFAGEERLMREAKLRKTQFRTWRAASGARVDRVAPPWPPGRGPDHL